MCPARRPVRPRPTSRPTFGPGTKGIRAGRTRLTGWPIFSRACWAGSVRVPVKTNAGTANANWAIRSISATSSGPRLITRKAAIRTWKSFSRRWAGAWAWSGPVRPGWPRPTTCRPSVSRWWCTRPCPNPAACSDTASPNSGCPGTCWRPRLKSFCGWAWNCAPASASGPTPTWTTCWPITTRCWWRPAVMSPTPWAFRGKA